jgi:hypothetical protein
MESEITHTGRGIVLATFAMESHCLSTQEFLKRHGDAFLLLRKHTSELVKPYRGQATMQMSFLPSSPGVLVPRAGFYVYPVRRRAESEYPFVTIGRDDTCDVMLEDASVSSFHAYIKEFERGRYTIQDSRSRNGTRVNGIAVARRGEGAPRLLCSGDTLRIGAVPVSFLLGLPFVELLRSLFPQESAAHHAER